MPEVTPRFKSTKDPKPKRPKRLRAGKKSLLDRGELANTRLALIARSNGRCEAGFSERCTGYGQQQHHLLSRSQGGTNDETNLLWVCIECHVGSDGIHRHPSQAEEVGLRRPSTTPALPASATSRGSDDRGRGDLA